MDIKQLDTLNWNNYNINLVMKSFATALVLCAGLSQAGNSKGIWTDHDWFDEVEGVGVKNGVPYGIDPST